MDAQELKIKDYLLEGIVTEQFKEDKKMPSEYMLVEQFNVPRIKVRNVYNLLEKMGYIYSRQGIGRFMKHQRKQLDVVMTGDVSFTEKMMNQTAHYKSIVTKVEQVPPEHSIYSKPYVDASNTLYLIERLRFIEDEPAAIHRSYVVVENFSEIKQASNRISSMYAFYKKHGFTDFHSSFSQLEVAFPTELDRVMLGCEMLVPLVRVESDNWANDQQILLEYTEILYRTDRFSFQLLDK
ncbi:GntR family transcriptional regulator [Solibacillus daqui]|uniref:GntR family transcriptional regulator n=1 Tax=Solibacillus daqui TaxID=2912187 RepID=UPI00236569E5|nr:GntR family transcriptional regulator [Solibacillus daqui]